MSSVSLCMIVKNETNNLPKCLKSIKGRVDEIIIVDTGSTDNTIDIAKSFGATIIESTWENDFAKARNLSIKNAKSDWILWMDADDFMPEESYKPFKNLIEKPRDAVYGFRIRNEKPNGTGTEFIQARLFPNNIGLNFERPVHEQVMLSAARAGLRLIANDNVVVEHHGYADDDELKVKAMRNADILEKNIEVYGIDPVTFVELGDSYTILEDFETALKWYRKTIEVKNGERQFPDIISQGWMGIGNIANRNEDYDTAIDAFNKVIKLSPSRVDLFYNLAVTYEKTGDLYKAIETLSNIYSTEKQTVKVGVDYRLVTIKGAIKMIKLLLKLEDEKLLDKWITLFLSLYSDRPEIHNLAGIVWYRTGKVIESLKEYEQSLKMRKDGNVDAFIGLILIYLMAQKDDVALKTVDTGSMLFKSSCRFMVFRTLFLEDNEDSNLEDFDIDLINSEVSYILDMFGVTVVI